MKIMVTSCSNIILTEDSTRMNTLRLEGFLLAIVMEQIAYFYLKIRITLANLYESKSIKGLIKNISEFSAVLAHVVVRMSIQPD